jgi:hypothetical protein
MLLDELQVGRIGDSPNEGTDGLGYESYAKALVEHIFRLEKSGAVSVGLLSPWGSGKSFFWKLIKKEFEKRSRPKNEDTPTCACIDESWCLVIVASLICKWITAAFVFLIGTLLCCYETRKWKIHEENENMPFYICIEFDAWTYRGSDNLWASMLETLWTRVEEEFGSEEVKWHRIGFEREDGNPPYTRKEQMIARKKFALKRNIVISLTAWVLIGFIGLLLYLIREEGRKNMESTDSTYIEPRLYVWILAVPSLLGTFLTLVLNVFKTRNEIEKSGIQRITEKIKLTERKDFKQEIGFMGFVKEEVEHLFEFVKLKNARIVLFVDDLDR